MPDHPFHDRQDAGRILAGLLQGYRDRDGVVVLGLPRGGIPVAYEVATALNAPLDVLPVRKLGLPSRPELAMGAVAAGQVVLNDDVVHAHAVSLRVISTVIETESRELVRRERAYRAGRPMVDVAGRTVILVDDGLATGASMRVAIQAVRSLHPARLVLAVPVAPRSRCAEFATEVNEVVCAATPTPFVAVGAAYRRFPQTTDDEVRELLNAAAVPAP